MNRTIILISLLAFAGASSAEEYTVGQKDKKFTVSNLQIKTGDTVKFLNEDPFSHNVYSLSEVKSFDLGSYPKGEARAVTFDKPGKVDVGCAIHYDMAMTIDVK